MHGFEWNLGGMLQNKYRSACGGIIHVQRIWAELWSLTRRIFTHFSLSSQTSLHGFEWNLAQMYNKSRSACGEIIHIQPILAELWSLTLRIFTHLSLSSQLLHPCMGLNETWGPWMFNVVLYCWCHSDSASVLLYFTLGGMLQNKYRSAYGEIIHVWQIWTELWSLSLRICTHFSLSSQLLLHPCRDLNETWQGCCTTSLEVYVGR